MRKLSVVRTAERYYNKTKKKKIKFFYCKKCKRTHSSVVPMKIRYCYYCFPIQILEEINSLEYNRRKKK